MYELRCFLLIVFTLMPMSVGCAGPMCSWRAHPPYSANLKELPTSAWAQLLLRGNDYTCAGSVLGDSPKGMRPVQRMKHHVFVDAAGEGRHLIWLITHANASSEHGPVALVEGHAKHVRAYATGVLTLPRGKTELTYHYGEEFESLWATSTACEHYKPLRRPCCRRALQVMPRLSNSLVQRGAPIVVLDERAKALGAGWHRVSRRSADVVQHKSFIIISEEIDEHERLSRRPGMAPRQRKVTRHRWSRVLMPPV